MCWSARADHDHHPSGGGPVAPGVNPGPYPGARARARGSGPRVRRTRVRHRLGARGREGRLTTARKTPNEPTRGVIPMATIHFSEQTSAAPEQFVASLTDFGPGRQELFKNSSDEYLEVHSSGVGHADVTEGSGGVWERLEYDWSDPHRVVMKTVDSNLWGGASGHTYTFTPLPDGRTQLDVVVVREGKNLKGR